MSVFWALWTVWHAPTVALDIGRNAEEFAATCNRRDYGGGGDFYAVRPLAAMNVNPDHGVLRLALCITQVSRYCQID